MAMPALTRPVEVVLIDLPEVLSDIVVAILERDPGVRIAAQLRNQPPPLSASVGAFVDVAIVSGEGETLADALHELLCRRPRLRMLRVGGDGRESWLYELRPHRTTLGEVSPATLLEAVKSVGDHGCAGRSA